MVNLVLQNIVDDISFDSLPVFMQSFNFKSFSRTKSLYDFQQKALENTVKALWTYYGNPEDFSSFAEEIQELKRKERFFRKYSNNDFSQNFDFDLKKKEGKKSAKFLLEYDKDYPVTDNKINFRYFINRMSFWMATGSGKTLVIVKLLEILHKSIKNKDIPQNDILFLTHREDLIKQFKEHIDEFNSHQRDVKISLKNLREYENVKRESVLPFRDNEITVFYYRSDLVSDEHKEKLVDFKNYDNAGKWYIILDEAHKGDKEDSKRQMIYSVLSRNGFLFNFSATFTDPRDYATCVFNFNLSRYIEEGYGKHIYLSEQEISAFRDKTDFSPIEKQKIVLKTLILYTYIDKYSVNQLKEKDKELYHKPLLLTLVNSVNTEDSDLMLFFQEIEEIGSNKIKNKLFEQAKKEIIEEFNSKPKCIFEEMEFSLITRFISDIKHEDVLKHIFHAKTSGSIEVLKIPGNKKELIFKLRTAEKPFASIKIGDISVWLREKLQGYEINESYDNESVFEKINHDDSDINILMGSRSFYEGWDSNRPNLILFVNIGLVTDAKKFVLQAVGRGVRIEPVKDKRKRAKNLYNNKEISESLYTFIIRHARPVETLFVFGTNADNLKEIIATLRQERPENYLGSELNINKQIGDSILLIPDYQDSSKIFAEEKAIQKFLISKEDFSLTKTYFDYIGDVIALAHYECELKVLEKVGSSFTDSKCCYDFSAEQSLQNPGLTLKRIISHYSLRQKEFDGFKKVQDEIVHFKRIKYHGDDMLSEFLTKIKQVGSFGEKAEKEKQLELDFDTEGDLEKYKRGIQQLERDYKNEAEFKDLKIKYIQNHYYIPLILSEKEKIDYISHVVKLKSEVNFVKELERYAESENNFFSKFDWWFFSKLDESLDEIYIPYYNPKENRISKFKPDFIFWLKKGKKYYILFIDPKGTEHTDAYRKIDGFTRIFEAGSNEKLFKYNEYSVSVKLLLRPKDKAKTIDRYQEYWFDNIAHIEKVLM